MLISHPNVQNIIYKPYSFFTQIRLKLDPNSGHFHIPGTLIYMRGNPRNQLSAGIFFQRRVKFVFARKCYRLKSLQILISGAEYKEA